MSTRRVFLSGAVAAAVGAALAACTEVEQDLPTPSAIATPSAHPALTADKLTTILERIQTGLNAADADKSPDSLVGYLTGPAARVRAEEYAIAQATGDDKFVHTFITTSQAGVAGLTTDFPRTALVVTEPAAEGEAPYLLILTQDDARNPYQMWGWARLSGQSQVPTTSTTVVGSESVSADATGLVATPQEVLDAYIDALNNPTGENGTAFADDTLRQRIAAERAIDLGGMGTVTVTAAAGSDGFKGLRTTANGALVMTTVTFSTVYRNTVARSTITVGGTVAKMLGDNASVVGTVTVTYDAMVAFSIPSASEGGQSTVIGLDLVPAKAERDDSQAPTG
jgi:hypothetical protein